jgi:hypothetical protein
MGEADGSGTWVMGELLTDISIARTHKHTRVGFFVVLLKEREGMSCERDGRGGGRVE